jgi:hypothetical protein
VTGKNKNLIPFNKSNRSKDEIREINARGGRKSGETRRKKKSMREKMELLLSLPADDTDADNLKALGISPDDIDNEMIIIKALFDKAASGDINAIREVRNILGVDNAAEDLKLRNKDSKRKDKELELKEKTFENNNW